MRVKKPPPGVSVSPVGWGNPQEGPEKSLRKLLHPVRISAPQSARSSGCHAAGPTFAADREAQAGTMKLEDIGLIGNCQFAALVHASGDVVWCCWPRFDSEPVFGKLLDPDGGRFGISAPDCATGHQQYLDNTNVLETTFDMPDGRVRVIDFAPRFERHGRMYRPTQLIRIVEPMEGSPQIRVHCEPVLGWSKTPPAVSSGS